MKRILLVGDSITQYGYMVEHRGWSAQLAQWCIRRADIVNRGLSGYNTRWIRGFLEGKEEPLVVPPLPSDGHYDLATVFLGANDASCEYQHVPLEEYKANLIAIVDHLMTTSKIPNVLVVTPGPVEDAAWLEHQRGRVPPGGEKPTVGNRSFAVAAQYAAAAREATAVLQSKLKEGQRVELVDIHSAMTKGTHEGTEFWKTCLSDGLHFAANGSDVLFQEIRKIILEKFPSSWHPEPEDNPPMPMALPHYSAFEPRQQEA